MKTVKFLIFVIITALLVVFSSNCKQTTKREPTTTVKAIKNEALATLEYKIKAKLGEGAFWNHLTNELYWVDIEGKKLHIYNPKTKTDKSLNTPSRISTVVPKDTLNAVISLEDGIYLINIKTGALTPISDIEKDKPYNRFNDGKCDPSGRLWVGSMNLDAKTQSAALYMVDSKGNAEKKLDSITISNGIVWTSDKKTMYYIDTPLQNIRAFDYDDKTGNISNERVAVIINDSLGSPDGMTIDENNELWVALWGGSAIGHFDPKTGKLIKKVTVPAQNVTSCAFGGENLDTLYITSASLYMSKENISRYPNAGAIFKYYPGVKGVKSSFFK